jgi:hypothetical protein
MLIDALDVGENAEYDSLYFDAIQQHHQLPEESVDDLSAALNDINTKYSAAPDAELQKRAAHASKTHGQLSSQVPVQSSKQTAQQSSSAPSQDQDGHSAHNTLLPQRGENQAKDAAEIAMDKMLEDIESENKGAAFLEVENPLITQQTPVARTFDLAQPNGIELNLLHQAGSLEDVDEVAEPTLSELQDAIQGKPAAQVNHILDSDLDRMSDEDLQKHLQDIAAHIQVQH